MTKKKQYAIDAIRQLAAKEGLQEEEAAKKLGYSEGAYRAHLFREKVRLGGGAKRRKSAAAAVVVHTPPPPAPKNEKAADVTLFDSLKALDDAIKNIKKILGVKL